VLYNPSFTTRPALRHRCRNPRCGSKLRDPTDSRLDAFCSPACFASFYRSRCLVCEQPFTRKTERRLLCGRAKCRHEIQRHRERFSATRYLGSVLGLNGSRSADKIPCSAGADMPEIPEVLNRAELSVMAIHTSSSLRARHRRLGTRVEKSQLVLDEMQRGCALHLMHTPTGPHWALSNGRQVSDNVAKLIIASSSVIDCGDALFAGAAAQTFRWWSDTEEPAA
jgi:hypothetical protein